MPKTLFPDDPEFEKFYLAQRRRRRRLIVLFVVLPLMIPLLAILGLHVWGSYAVRAAYRDLAAKGYPTSLAELDESYSIPEGPNAAQAFMTAVDMVQVPPSEETLEMMSSNLWEGYDPAIWHNPEAPLLEQAQFTEEQFRTIDVVLRMNGPALQALDAARQMNAPSRYPVGLSAGFAVMISPSLEKTVEITRIACLSARVNTQRGKVDEAVIDLQRAMALTNSLRSQPITMTQLVRMFSVQQISWAIGKALESSADLSVEQIRKLREGVAEFEDLDSIRFTMAGELLESHAIFDSLDLSTGRFATNSQYLTYALELITGLIHLDRLQHLNYMRDVLEASSRDSLSERISQSQIIEAAHDQKWKFMISRGLLAGRSPRLSELDARAIAASRLAVVGLSIEMFRKQHGRLPESLDELVPEILAAVPLDPFTDQPMIYRTQGNGYLLYSVGEDRTDNDGAKRNAAGDEYESGADIPFRVRWREE